MYWGCNSSFYIGCCAKISSYIEVASPLHSCISSVAEEELLILSSITRGGEQDVQINKLASPVPY